MIYRDDEFAILEVVKGISPSSVITIRGVGGRVGDIEFVHEDQTDWRPDLDYLVFLRLDETPTREGFETAWTLVEIGQGAMARSKDGGWINPAGIEVLEALGAGH